MEYFDFETATDLQDRSRTTENRAEDVSQRRSASCSGIESPERRNSRLNAKGVETLKTWLSLHYEHPYIAKDELASLESSTGLTRNQIKRWLSNARRRGRSRSRSVGLSRRKSSNDLVGPTMKARSRDSHIWQEVDMAYSRLRSPSVESLRSARSSDNDGPWLSDANILSEVIMGPGIHKRRRRNSGPRPNIVRRPRHETAKSDHNRIYQCTFCTGSFGTKYDWQRHEKTSHLTLEKWVCCPFSLQRDSTTESDGLCVFCPQLISDNHISEHNFSICQTKPYYERTFYRKDHFVQHLKLSHNTIYQRHMLSWKEDLSELKSRCGFCGLEMTSWNGRTDHLASHFREGFNMSQWTGSWGFDKHIENMVLNAIQPHLIGLELRAMNPFVAPSFEDLYGFEDGQSLEQAISGSHSYNRRGDGTWYGWLGSELGKFVEEQRILGVTVTDEDLRLQARILTYDDPDPWNWTLADDSVWMNDFRAQHDLLDLDGLCLD